MSGSPAETPPGGAPSQSAVRNLTAVEAALELAPGQGPFVQWTLGPKGAQRQITERGHLLVLRLVDVLTGCASASLPSSGEPPS